MGWWFTTWLLCSASFVAGCWWCASRRDAQPDASAFDRRSAESARISDATDWLYLTEPDPVTQYRRGGVL